MIEDISALAKPLLQLLLASHDWDSTPRIGALWHGEDKEVISKTLNVPDYAWGLVSDPGQVLELVADEFEALHANSPAEYTQLVGGAFAVYLMIEAWVTEVSERDGVPVSAGATAESRLVIVADAGGVRCVATQERESGKLRFLHHAYEHVAGGEILASVKRLASATLVLAP